MSYRQTQVRIHKDFFTFLNDTIDKYLTCYHSNRRLAHLDLVREKPMPAGLKLLGNSTASRAKTEPVVREGRGWGQSAQPVTSPLAALTH